MLAAALTLPLGGVQAQSAAQSAAQSTRIEFEEQQASREAQQLAAWIGASGDASGRPFAIVDKTAARVYLFDPGHRLIGVSDVLLGQTVGDHTVAGVGQRAQIGRVGLNERTTPAGRFETRPGRNHTGEHVVWLDYQAAFSMHRLRAGASEADRQARLATPSPQDNRASLGCVVVPEAFYLQKVQPLLGRFRGVVYVLPESSPPTQFAAQDL